MKCRTALFSGILLLFCILGCTNQAIDRENTRLKTQLDSLKMQLEAKDVGKASLLVHLVFFKTRSQTSANALKSQLKRLKNIGEVKTLSVGHFQDLGDPRAFGDYDLVVSMTFTDSTSYRRYQEHPLHLKIKERTRELLAAPPISYDYHNK